LPICPRGRARHTEAGLRHEFAARYEPDLCARDEIRHEDCSLAPSSAASCVPMRTSTCPLDLTF
jgi:hypothetical protein